MLTALRQALAEPATIGQALPLAILVLLLAFVVAQTLRSNRDAGNGAPEPTRWERFGDWLGIPLKTRTGQVAFVVFGAAYLALFILALLVTFALLGATLVGAELASGAPLGLGALLVALLGAPFLIWRTVVAQKTLDTAQRQTDLQDEALFNDKINAAATDLAARRQVTRVVQQDGKDVVLTEWEDDLVTRAAAIDRLEGLALEALERADVAPAQRIARMLSIYVRELSETNPPKQPPIDRWNEMAEGDEDMRPLNSDEIHSMTGLRPDDVSESAMAQWSGTLRPARRDMERAAQSLGRIIPIDRTLFARFDAQNVNLSSCNLQGMDLRGLNFERALFRDANLIGARMSGSSFKDADLRRADLRWANFGPSDW